MNNFLRQTIAALLAVTLVLTPAIPANAMTKKQVNNQITKLQKQIRKPPV